MLPTPEMAAWALPTITTDVLAQTLADTITVVVLTEPIQVAEPLPHQVAEPLPHQAVEQLLLRVEITGAGQIHGITIQQDFLHPQPRAE
jgi:hypothetical protein